MTPIGNSKVGSGDISSTHDYANWISLSCSSTIYAQGEGKTTYFTSGKPEADARCEVHRINRLKEFLGHDMCFQVLFIHVIIVSEMPYLIFGVGKTAFQTLAKRRPCPSILCQRINCPEPYNIGYLKA